MKKLRFLILIAFVLFASAGNVFALELTYSGSSLTSLDVLNLAVAQYNGTSYDSTPSNINETISLTVTGANTFIPAVIELPCSFPAQNITVRVKSEDVSGDVYVDTTISASFNMTQLTLNAGTYGKNRGTDRHFILNSGGILILDSGVILDGSGTGGGIEVNGGAITLNGVTFSNNTSENGGAMKIASGASVTFAGTSSFNTNIATANGGAIYNEGTATFSGNVGFSNNDANTGGAIYNSGTVRFNMASEFENNTALLGNGGAIFANNGSLTDFLTDVEFKTNIASGDGGAIYAQGNINPRGTATFSGNTSNNGNGGAIYYVSGGFRFGSTYSFIENKAENGNGGAVYCPGNVTVDGATFSGNASENNAQNGGAIYATGTVTVSSGTFSKNKASNSGGAIYTFNNTNTSVTISGGEFSGNDATFGGAVFTAGGVDVTEGTFSTNTANSGGVIYSSGDVAISNGTFDSNSSGGVAGGVLYSAGETTISGGTFTKNTAEASSGLGGVVYSTQNVTISGGTFGGSNTNANSASSGGVIFSPQNVTVSGGLFSYNNAKGTTDGSYGGVIFASGDVTLSGTPTFSNNSAVRHGGAIYTAGKVALNGDVIFEANKTTSTSTSTKSHGGAIYAVGEVTGNSSYSPYFVSNESNYSGGAIYTESNITLENVSFDSNISNRDGGGGAVYTRGIATFTNSIFTGNSAIENSSTSGGGRGGAIFADGSVTIDKCTFGGTDSRQGNSAHRDGGAIHTGGSGTSSITESVFRGNMATTTNNASGGAIYLENSNPQHEFTIKDCIFINNRAQSEGGALRIDGKTLMIMRCYFYNNQSNSAINGGAAYLAAARVVVVNSTFYNNTSSGGYGGAINLSDIDDPGDETTSAALLMNTFVNNSCGAGRGGAIYLTRENGVEMFGNLLVGNTAPERSGKDIFLEEGKRVRSTGYNILTNIGVLTSGTPSTVNWKNTAFVIGNYDRDEVTEYDVTYFFGDEITTDTSSLTIGANDTETLYALHLNYGEGIANIALGFVQNSAAKTQFISKNINASDYTDALGNLRPNSYNWDTGSRQESNGITSPEDQTQTDTNQITAIRISGLPVTLRRVGQTASLVVYGLDAGGNIISRDMKVVWTYDDYFVKIDENNTIIALNLTTQEPGGYTTITATASTPGGDRIDSKKIKITEGRGTGRYSNISEKYLEEIGEFNASVSDASVAMGSAASNNATLDLVQADTFQNEFRSTYPGAATTVTQVESITDNDDLVLESDDVDYRDSDNFVAVKDGIDLMLNRRNKGDILPVEYSWTYSKNDLQNLLGSSYSEAALNPDVLSNVLRATFRTDDGKFIPVVGSNAVNMKDAFTANDLAIDTDNEDNAGGAIIRFTAYLANINSSSSKLINSTSGNKLLVVPDGVDSDSRIAGTMFILQKALNAGTNNNNNNNNNDNSNSNTTDSTESKSSGGGGGGCNSFASVSCLIVLALLFRKTKR